MATLIDWALHLDAHLSELLLSHGAWVYVLLFVAIFVETGLVVLPFLPGDSLLFVAGTLAAGGGLRLLFVLLLLVAAAVAGDAVNFAAGAWFGARKRKRPSRWLNPEHLRLTKEFFARHGGKTIVLARFVPIVRTLAPFVAGVGGMRYRRFVVYNVTGAVLWVGSVTLAGYQFGHIAWVRQNLTYVLLGMVVVSVLPGALQWIRKRRPAAH